MHALQRNFPTTWLVVAAYATSNGCCSKGGKRSNKERNVLPSSCFRTNFSRFALKCKMKERTICNRSVD